MESFARSLWRSFTLVYGVLAGLVWIALTIRDGSVYHRRNRRVTERDIADARDRLWNLGKAPLPDFTHAFFTTPDDDAPVTLHYVASAWDAGRSPNLVVFLHGFPDSWVLWKDFLSQDRNLDRENTVYVALDLPGYGGSDGLGRYNAYNVLEAVTSFVLGMREKYQVDDGEDGAVGVQDRGRVVLVSHDWGGAVASRLASEAPQLADHFVIASVVLPRLFISNAQARISSARRMLHTWSKQPLSFRLLRNAYNTIKPLLIQLRKSHYIFAFNLPDLMARVLGTFAGAWFLSKIHRTAASGVETDGVEGAIEEAAEALASALGPAVDQYTTSLEKPSEKQDDAQSTPLTYPSSVHTRAQSPSHAWFQKTRYYRDGLILGRWSKSLQTILSLSVLDSSNSTLVSTSTATSPTSGKYPSTGASKADGNHNGVGGEKGGDQHRRRRRSSTGLYSSQSRRSSLSVGASLFDASSGPSGALRAPTTLVVGAKDLAFDWRLCLEGVGDHLGRGGAVVMLEGADHWAPVRERIGIEVLRRCVGSVIGAELEGMDGSGVVVGSGGVVNGAGTGGQHGVKELLRGLEGVKVTVER